MAIRIQCPSCQTKLSCADERQGKPVACPRCKGQFVARPMESHVKATPPLPVAAIRRAGNVPNGTPAAVDRHRPAPPPEPVKRKSGLGCLALVLCLVLGG